MAGFLERSREQLCKHWSDGVENFKKMAWHSIAIVPTFRDNPFFTSTAGFLISVSPETRQKTASFTVFAT